MLIVLKMLNIDIPIWTQFDDLDFPFKENYCTNIVKLLGFSNYHKMYSEISAKNQLVNLTVKGTFSHVHKKLIENYKYNGSLIGLRIEESKGRKHVIKTYGTLFEEKSGFIKCFPIAYLSGYDIFALILKEQIPYIEIYDKHGNKPPHEIRFSWMLSPDFINRGNAIWLKINYPNQFYKLCEINPIIRSYA